MVFYTPVMAAQHLGSYSQLFSPWQGRELQRAGRFLCTLIEKEIASSELARESHNKIFPKLLNLPPLPPGPGNALETEYFYGSFLLSITETEKETREKYGTECLKMEQQLCQEILNKPRLEDICRYTLRAASIHYLKAAAMHLYSPESKPRAKTIKHHLQQAIVRYNRLNTIFDYLDAVPEMTAARQEALAELNFLSEIEFGAGYRRKRREVKRNDPELMNIRNLGRVYGLIAYALGGYVPGNWFHTQRSLKKLRDKDSDGKGIKMGVYDFWDTNKHKLLRQDVVLGLMCCYALQGNYHKIRETAGQLERFTQKPDYLPSPETIAYAHRIELGAQENRISSRKCRPFVPLAPESVVQDIEEFISSYERAPQKLVMRSPFFGEQEVGREVRLAA